MALTKITSNAFAASAVDSDAVGANTITTVKIADNNVTHAKLHTDMDLSSKTVTLPTISSLTVSGGDTHLDGRNSAGLTLDLSGTGHYTIREHTTNDIVKLGGTGSVNFIAHNISSGYVGIGTDAPDRTFHVKSASSAVAKFETSGSSYAGVELKSISGVSNGDTAAYLYAYNASTFLGGLKFVRKDSNSGEIVLRQQINSANTDVVTISDGNVGIGTTSPTSKLHVYGTSGNQYVRAEATANSSRSALITLGKQSDGTVVQGFFGSVGDANQVEVASTSNHPLRIYTNNSPNTGLTMDTSGQIGINTSGSVTARLHVREAVSNTVSPATALAKFEGTGFDGLAFGNTQSPPFTSWIQAGYLSNTYSPAWNNGYPIALNPVGGNVGIGTTNPSEELHIYDAGNDPYVLVDGSGANRDSGYKINAGNGVKIMARANAVGHMFLNDDSISILGQIGNGGYRSHIFDSEIQVGGRYGSTNPARVVVARVIEPKDLSLPSGWVVQGGQIDTVSGTAYKRPSTAPNNTAFFGPYGLFPPGSYTALFRMKVTDNSSTSGWGFIDVSGGAVRDPVGSNPRPRIQTGLSPSSFGASNRYQYFALDFECINSGEQIEFRWISWVGGLTDLWLDHILVVPRLNHN